MEVNLKLYTPLAHQLPVHQRIENHLKTCPRGLERHQEVFCVVSPRQVGKSMMAINELLRFAFTYNKGNSIYLTPALGLGRKIYKELLDAVPDNLIKSKNGIDLEIQFINGHRVNFKSAEQGDALRGYTVKRGIFVIDEATSIRDEMYDKILQPYTDFNKEITLVVSTPKYRQGWFYREYMKGLSKGTSFNFSDYDLTSVRSKEKLEELRLTVPSHIFKNEYLGEFIDFESNVFGDYSKVLSSVKPEYEELFVGIDWANGDGGDDTVVASFNEKGEMYDFQVINDMTPTEQVDKIKEILTSWGWDKIKKILVEKNSIGTVYGDMLKKMLIKDNRKLQVDFFVTTNSSKKKIIDEFKLAIEQANLTLPNEDLLLDQLNNYESSINAKTNVVTYNARTGAKDDIVFATLLAWRAYQSRFKKFNFVII